LLAVTSSFLGYLFWKQQRDQFTPAFSIIHTEVEPMQLVHWTAAPVFPHPFLLSSRGVCQRLQEPRWGVIHTCPGEHAWKIPCAQAREPPRCHMSREAKQSAHSRLSPIANLRQGHRRASWKGESVVLQCVRLGFARARNSKQQAEKPTLAVPLCGTESVPRRRNKDNGLKHRPIFAVVLENRGAPGNGSRSEKYILSALFPRTPVSPHSSRRRLRRTAFSLLSDSNSAGVSPRQAAVVSDSQTATLFLPSAAVWHKRPSSPGSLCPAAALAVLVNSLSFMRQQMYPTGGILILCSSLSELAGAVAAVAVVGRGRGVGQRPVLRPVLNSMESCSQQPLQLGNNPRVRRGCASVPEYLGAEKSPKQAKAKIGALKGLLCSPLSVLDCRPGKNLPQQDSSLESSSCKGAAQAPACWLVLHLSGQPPLSRRQTPRSLPPLPGPGVEECAALPAGMEVGMRVVRGVDWKWGSQDDGEGHVGTVVEIGRQGSTTTPDKTVVVQWDNGTRTNYRTGYQGAYDLLLYDNAQIGVRHSNIICDSCKKHGIMGMRWKCKVCFDYDLCTQCYMNNKHDLSHAFERYETAHSQPAGVEQMSGACPPRSERQAVLNGVFFKKGYSTALTSSWSAFDGGWGDCLPSGRLRATDTNPAESFLAPPAPASPSCTVTSAAELLVALTPRQNLSRIILKGIFQGVRVVRGPDWDWGNQDGGEGKIGKVVDIRGWDTESGRSVASVTWSNGTTNVYRMGHKGKVDLKYVSDVAGGYYYKDHLPKLGEHAELQRQESADGHAFQQGDKVKCLLEVDILRQMQEGHGGWNPKMAEYISRIGTVHRITDRGDVRVQYSNNIRWTFHPGALTKVHTFGVGDLVRVLDDMDSVKRLQAGHGEWTDSMAPALGQMGKVLKVYADGDLRVAFGGQTWTFNPACLTSQPVEVDANLMTTENPNESGSTVISVLEKLLSQSTELDHPGRLVIEAAHGSASKVRDLVQKYPDKVDIKNQGKTALQVAAHQGHVEVVKVLLQANSSIEVKDEDGDTALHYTAFGNQAETARLLLSKALHIAVNKGFTEVVRVLSEHNADVNLQDSYGDTPLHDAIAKDFRNIIEILTEVPTIDFTQQNTRGFNLLHHAALKGNKLATEKILARARQLVDVKKDDGFSALHLAALNNHRDVAEILLKEGRCDVNIRNNRNQTPLQLAVTQGHAEMVQLLVTEGADVNAEDEDGDTAMHIALSRQQLAATVAASEGEGSSLYARLHGSGLLGNLELNVGAAMACFLAQEGADINYANHKGKHPLDLVTDGMVVQLIKNFSEKHRDQQLQSHSCGTGVGSSSLRRVHTTPNTMTNLAMPSSAGPSECLICSELALLVLFCPCQHSVACEECAHRMKKCIKCQVTITKKIRQDNTEVECSPSSENSDQHNLLEQLQFRFRQMEERITCPICIDNQIKLVFQCGHASCVECSAALKTCPICRQAIRERIQLFV
ncbi:MIB2 ligase, partial [Atractosteus spatula]|nr:MIB2 ligase [Atractosteus spatula]